MRGVILSAAKNPEGDGSVYDAHIVWILHFGLCGAPFRMTLCHK